MSRENMSLHQTEQTSKAPPALEHRRKPNFITKSAERAIERGAHWDEIRRMARYNKKAELAVITGPDRSEAAVRHENQLKADDQSNSVKKTGLELWREIRDKNRRVQAVREHILKLETKDRPYQVQSVLALSRKKHAPSERTIEPTENVKQSLEKKQIELTSLVEEINANNTGYFIRPADFIVTERQGIMNAFRRKLHGIEETKLAHMNRLRQDVATMKSWLAAHAMTRPEQAKARNIIEKNLSHLEQETLDQVEDTEVNTLDETVFVPADDLASQPQEETQPILAPKPPSIRDVVEVEIPYPNAISGRQTDKKIEITPSPVPEKYRQAIMTWLDSRLLGTHYQLGNFTYDPSGNNIFVNQRGEKKKWYSPDDLTASLVKQGAIEKIQSDLGINELAPERIRIILKKIMTDWWDKELNKLNEIPLIHDDDLISLDETQRHIVENQIGKTAGIEVGNTIILPREMMDEADEPVEKTMKAEPKIEPMTYPLYADRNELAQVHGLMDPKKFSENVLAYDEIHKNYKYPEAVIYLQSLSDIELEDFRDRVIDITRDGGIDTLFTAERARRMREKREQKRIRKKEPEITVHRSLDEENEQPSPANENNTNNAEAKYDEQIADIQEQLGKASRQPKEKMPAAATEISIIKALTRAQDAGKIREALGGISDDDLDYYNVLLTMDTTNVDIEKLDPKQGHHLVRAKHWQEELGSKLEEIKNVLGKEKRRRLAYKKLAEAGVSFEFLRQIAADAALEDFIMTKYHSDMEPQDVIDQIALPAIEEKRRLLIGAQASKIQQDPYYRRRLSTNSFNMRTGELNWKARLSLLKLPQTDPAIKKQLSELLHLEKKLTTSSNAEA